MSSKSMIGVVLALCACGAFATDWTFVNGTITDGDWTFAATVKANTTDLTVGAVSADPGSGATLDFSKPVTDGSTTYTIVKLNPQFKNYADNANLETLVLPATGLDEISQDAFNGCSSLTSVSPFLPDSVTIIGNGAFKGVPVGGALLLKGAKTVNSGAFYQTAITSVTFGANLTLLKGGWQNGCFGYCTSLTTINFDPDMSGATMSGECIFAGCNSVSGTIDFRGFASYGHRPFYGCNNNLNVPKLLLSSASTTIGGALFHSLRNVKEVEFDGGVPSAIDQFIAALNDSGSTFCTDLYVTVPEAYKDDWAVYCENGVIDEFGSYWDPELVPNTKSKNFFLVYRSAGGGGALGHWVYNASTGTVSDGDWTFAATVVGKSVTVGACSAYPAAGGCLDFSASLTDTDGQSMVFATLNPALYAGSFNDSIAASDAGLAILELKFPESHLTAIGAGAFPKMVNCTNIVNYLPDSVSSIGKHAFYGCPIVADLKLRGVGTIDQCAFKSSAITSVEFGKDLASYASGYTSGAIFGCLNLTNISLHAEMSGAEITGEHAFGGNTKLEGTLDMRGFKMQSKNGRPFDNTKVAHVIFSGTGDNLGTSIFQGAKGLETVTFLGEPPANAENIFNN